MLGPGRIPAGEAADSARGRPPLRRGRTPRQENVDATSTRPWRDVGATSAWLRRKSSVNCLILGAFLPVRRPAAAGGLTQNPHEIPIAKPLYKTNAGCDFRWNHADSWSATTGGRGSHPAAPPHLIKELLPQMAGRGILSPRRRVTLTMTEMKSQNPSGRTPPARRSRPCI